MRRSLRSVQSVRIVLDQIIGKKVVKVDYDLTSLWDADGEEADKIVLHFEDGSALEIGALSGAVITNYEESR